MFPQLRAGGIFSGMFSLPASDTVLDDLGDKVLGHLVRCADLGRDDWHTYRKDYPAWVAEASERGIANWLHDRMWAHARREFFEVDGVTVKNEEPVRELVVSGRYRVRLKRHKAGDKIAAYPTAAALKFWGQRNPFAGFEVFTLGFGYRWDRETRTVGDALISMRKSLTSKPVWAVTLTGGSSAAEPIHRHPVEPTLPTIDLFDALDREEEPGT
jgi:hypothetical protein